MVKIKLLSIHYVGGAKKYLENITNQININNKLYLYK